MVTLPDVTAPLATTRSGSVLATRSGRVWRNRYSPHGFRMLAVAAGRCGFNGEFQEHSGIYLLGSYRGYNPALMRFHSADSASPFGRGGLNAYAYCLVDPVNYRDPTGHLPWWTWAAAGLIVPSIGGAALGWALGVATVSTKIAGVAVTGAVITHISALVVPEGEARTTLGLVSFALGVVAATASAMVVSKAPWGRLLGRGQRTADVPTVASVVAPPPALPTYKQLFLTPSPPSYEQVTDIVFKTSRAIRTLIS